MSTSIIRKVWMSVTGLFLITFITLHLAINLLTLLGDHAYFNLASDFMATNPFIQVMQYVLALGFIIHILTGIRLQIQNAKARPVNYVMNKPGENSIYSSRSMIRSGVIVLLFLLLHLKDYFFVLKFGDMSPFDDDYDLVVTLFSSPIYTAIYVLAFLMLAMHLNHGFQSAFQSLGARHARYTPFIVGLGKVFSILVGLGFSLIAIVHFISA